MGHWDDIRRAARARRATITGNQTDALAADTMLAAIARQTGISYCPVPPGDPLLDGAEAVLDCEADTIWYSESLDPGLRWLVLAHEYAHVWLHARQSVSEHCSASDLDPEASEENIPLGVKRIEGYGPAERREREANVFARELLLPTDLLRRWFLADRLEPVAIATRIGVSVGVVHHQLARALLIPVVHTRDNDAQLASSSAPVEGATIAIDWTVELDASQREAAHADGGPLLVEAGPGTGKTRTLVERIRFLLGRGVPASSILALTFSNRAAEEMRERVASIAPEAVQGLWIGTFHAFALELLRKYGTHLGLPPRFTVLDPVDALLLLEHAVPDLRLDYYHDLGESARPLRDILAAIARAKEELVDPEQYRALAEQMRVEATTVEAVEAAEKALEVAHVYHVYQNLLAHQHLLDFGDLIGRTVTLLQAHPAIREQVRLMYPHILVDEYQDVNQASACVLREIAGAGTGLWVVGDVRQAIYRFRGAAPGQLRQFARDFPGASTRTLACNYRSQPCIIDVFAGVVPHMRASTTPAPFIPWMADRVDEGGGATMTVTEDLHTEAAAIARAVSEHQAAGIPYRQQAILCRSHRLLARIAPLLEAAGIPVLYLGDLFERDEVRDLLALLSLMCDADGDALVRVARFPAYHVPLADVLALRALARMQHVPLLQALAQAQLATGISTQGRAGLARLCTDLDALGPPRSAWGLLVTYLFDCRTYLQSLLADTTTAGQQRRLALFQLLELAHEYTRATPTVTTIPELSPLHAFLRYVRQLALFGDEKNLRQIPEAAAEIDAVRLLTVHASKGLEFPVVYLPVLGQGHFPARRQPQPCPPPLGMLPIDPADDHDAEEECLFFVALSRARDHLHLSRAQHYGERQCSPSRLLELLPPSALQPLNVAQGASQDAVATHSPTRSRRSHISSSRDASPVAPATPDVLPTSTRTFDAERLDVYRRCPRQYAYMELLGHRSRSAHGPGHRARRYALEVIHWLQDMHAQGRTMDEVAALQKLAERWDGDGQDESPHAPFYRRQAERLVVGAVERLADRPNVLTRPKWEVVLPHGRVHCVPDVIEVQGDVATPDVVVQRWQTRRPSRSESEKDIYALYHAAAEHVYPPGAQIVLQAESLATGDVQGIPLSLRTRTTRLAHYDAAMAGILRAEFPAQPSEWECPQCAFYFLCPVPYDT